MHSRKLIIPVTMILFAWGLVFPAMSFAQDDDLMITAIEIRGNEVVTDQEILSAMTGRAGTTFSLNTLSADLSAIEALGWFAAEPEHILEPFESGVKIIIIVLENPTFVGVNITQEGPGIYAPGELSILFNIEAGGVINNNAVTTGVNAIERRYREDGYTAATITDVDVSDDGIIYIVLNEGVIGDIVIEGNTKTKTYVIMREIRTEIGTVFNAVTFRRDLERIYNLQLFEDIRPEIELNENREVVLKINVTESRTGQIGFGAGYSSNEGFLGTISYAERNFRGRGQQLQALGQIGGPSPDFQFTFANPVIDNHRTSFNIDIFSLNESDRIRNPDDPDLLTRFELKRTGGSIGVVRPTSENVTIALTLKFLEGNVTFLDEDGNVLAPEDVPELDESVWLRNGLVDGAANSLTTKIAHDTRDFTLDPTRGQVASAELSMFGQFLGGDFDAFKYILEYKNFYPLSSPPQDVSDLSPRQFHSSHVLAFRVLYGGSTGDLPIFERFEIGGQNSVRGTKETAQSGDTAILFNGEYRFPLGGNLGGAVFFDAGTAAEPGSSLNFSNLLTTVGLGVRYRISFFGVAPIRLDYGFDFGNNDSQIVFGFGHLF